MGHPVVLWSIDPQDWKKPGVEEVVRRVVREAAPGAIILLHDIHEDTVSAVPQIISELRSLGYGFTTVSDILRRNATIQLTEKEPPIPKT